MKQRRANVPCNGCTVCCQGDAVRLDQEEMDKSYLTEPHPWITGARMIAHKPTGECVYLGEKGCTIHDRAPSLCRAADCRSIALKYSFEKALRLHAMGLIDIRVWDQGRQLLEPRQLTR